MVIRKIRSFSLEVLDGPSAGARPGVYGRGIGPDHRHPTILSHEIREKITGWKTAAVDLPSALGWGNRLPRHGTGTSGGLAGSVYRGYRTAGRGDQAKARAAGFSATRSPINGSGDATGRFGIRSYTHAADRTNERADRSAYWAPTLHVAGRAVEPLALIATHTRRTVRPVDPFPAGLKVVAGDANARTAQSSRVTSWSCAVTPGARSSAIPSCSETRRGGLRLHVSFPDCWDGKRLDSADHKSHMAYSSHAACPRSHPVAVPALSLVVHYAVSGRRDAELASGGQFSGHADFLNAWNQAELASWVKRYLNRTLE